MIRPPPRSTLFPYPTLSRSALPLDGHHTPGVHRRARRWACSLPCACPSHEDPSPPPSAPTSPPDVCRQDRKSTRLNSSHANISYAVFCLKKKKKHNNETPSS